MRILVIGILVLIPLVLRAAPPEKSPPRSGEPGPYITVYHDEATSFQMRRDRIILLGEGLYKVWLRWLWAQPRPWKSGVETATMIVTELDCKRLQVRETMIMHKDRAGTLFDIEEKAPEQQRWKSFSAESGAAAAIARVCQLVPDLIHPAVTAAPETGPPGRGE